MTIRYCVRWNKLTQGPIEPLTEEQARQRHDAGQLYTAVTERDDRPRQLVVVNLELDYVGVEQLGPHGQEVDTLDFRQLDDGRLFCNQAIHLEYDQPDPIAPEDAARVERATFDLDGTMWVRVHERGRDEDRLLRGEADLTPNFEDDWGFGNYDRLLDFTRDVGREPDHPAQPSSVN